MTKHCNHCGTHIHTDSGLCHHCRNAKPQQISLEHRPGYWLLRAVPDHQTEPRGYGECVYVLRGRAANDERGSVKERMMGEKTGITWCDSTFNGYIGCTKVTAACDNCYAETLATRYGWVKWGHGEPRKLTSESNWRKPITWDKKALATYGRKQRVFAYSLSDICDTEVPDEWHNKFYQLQLQTPNTYWLALTKRASVARRIPFVSESTWLGTSLGSDKDMHMAHEIVKAPALLHWISYEPVIGPLNVYDLPEQIKWLVIGGESGHGARPFNIEWARSAVEACKDLGISVFVKQLGLHPTINGQAYPVSDSHGKILIEWPSSLRVQEFPI